MHRLSSVFLEPVSLGNYCVIIAIFLIAYWHELGLGVRLFLAISTLALLIGCDGRLAAASILIVSIGSAFVRKLSSQWSVLYLPIILLLSMLFVWNSNVDPTQDNFGGRVAGSMRTLSQVDFFGLLGFDAQLSDQAGDSGITYFVLTQSVVGITVIWLAVCLLPIGRDYCMRLYVHGIAMFIPLNLMVSYSFFSIKVASLMWFCFGYFYAKDSYRESPSPSGVGLRAPVGRAAV